MVHVQENDYLLLALRGLANYTGVLFDRLISHRQLPIEYSAVCGRNLFECYLMVAYILKEPSKAKEFISQKAFEDLEINEGFLSLTTATTSEASIKQIRERMDYIKEVIKTNGLTPVKKMERK